MTKKYLYTSMSGEKKIEEKFEIEKDPWIFVEGFDHTVSGTLYMEVPRSPVQLCGFVSVTNPDEQARLAPSQMVIEIPPNP